MSSGIRHFSCWFLRGILLLPSLQGDTQSCLGFPTTTLCSLAAAIQLVPTPPAYKVVATWSNPGPPSVFPAATLCTGHSGAGNECDFQPNHLPEQLALRIYRGGSSSWTAGCTWSTCPYPQAGKQLSI